MIASVAPPGVEFAIPYILFVREERIQIGLRAELLGLELDYGAGITACCGGLE